MSNTRNRRENVTPDEITAIHRMYVAGITARNAARTLNRVPSCIRRYYTRFRNGEWPLVPRTRRPPVWLHKTRVEIGLAAPLPDTARMIWIDDVRRCVGEHFDIPKSVMLGRIKRAQIAKPRQIAMYLCTELTSASVSRIGKHFGRDHTTVLYARDAMRQLTERDTDLAQKLTELRNIIIAYAAQRPRQMEMLLPIAGAKETAVEPPRAAEMPRPNRFVGVR